MRKVLTTLLLVSLLFVGWTGAQEQEPPVRKPVDQHWKVVPDVSPSDLEAELKRLNAKGYVITKSNLDREGDRYTIIVSNDDYVWSDEDGEGR